MFHRAGSKQGVEVKKRPLKLCCEENTASSNIKKKIKSSFDLDEVLLRLLSEVDPTFISKCHSFKNKLDIYHHLKKIDQELDDQLIRNTNPDNRKQEIIKELHNYNELKDATQSVIGVISTLTGESVTELHKKFEVYDTE